MTVEKTAGTTVLQNANSFANNASAGGKKHPKQTDNSVQDKTVKPKEKSSSGTDARKKNEKNGVGGGHGASNGSHTAKSKATQEGTRSSADRTNDDSSIAKHPGIGKRVRIKAKEHKGLTGRILTVSRGFWTIDHPDLVDKKIHCDDCEWIDTVGEDELTEYFRKMNEKMRNEAKKDASESIKGASSAGETKNTGTRSEMNQEKEKGGRDQQRTAQGDDGEADVVTLFDTEQDTTSAVKENSKNGGKDPHDDETSEKDKGLQNGDKTAAGEEMEKDVSTLESNDGDKLGTGLGSGASVDCPSGSNCVNSRERTRKRKRKSSLDSSTGQGSSRDPSPVHNPGARQLSVDHAVHSAEAVLVSQLDVDDNKTTRRQLNEHRGAGHVSALPPVVLNDRDEMPSSLAHLPQHLKINIFNRRTGKIMNGDKAVRVKDLPSVLRDHGEYEPIIPPPPSMDRAAAPSSSVREGRSSARVRVSAEVNSQVRHQDSSLEGRSVVVTSGPNRGMVGKIDGCIPGGWYLIEGIFREDDLALQLAISPEHLELIPDLDDKTTNQLPAQDSRSPNIRRGGDFVKEFQRYLSKHLSAPIRSLTLRVKALKEEKMVLNAQVLRLRNERASNQNAANGVAQVESHEEQRIQKRLRQIQGSLSKLEYDLREQVQSAGAARIIALQVFEQAKNVGT